MTIPIEKFLTTRMMPQSLANLSSQVSVPYFMPEKTEMLTHLASKFTIKVISDSFKSVSDDVNLQERVTEKGKETTINNCIRYAYNTVINNPSVECLRDKSPNKGILNDHIDEDNIAELSYFIWCLRHCARLKAREIMRRSSPEGALQVALLEARDLEKYGNKDGPTFESLFNVLKNKNPGSTDSQIFGMIIESSKRTSKETNSEFGILYNPISFPEGRELQAHNPDVSDETSANIRASTL